MRRSKQDTELLPRRSKYIETLLRGLVKPTNERKYRGLYPFDAKLDVFNILTETVRLRKSLKKYYQPASKETEDELFG